MNSLNYDVFSVIFDYLSQKECLNVSISSKDVHSIVKNQGFLKILHVNRNYPRIKFEDSFEMMKRIMMHKMSVQTIYIHLINNPCPWIFYWPKNIYFIGCYFDKGIIDPNKKVDTEYIYVRCKYNCKEIKINYDKFPRLKNVIVE